MASIRPVTCIGTPKNCSRCGQDYIDYSAEGLARVCPACRAPRPRAKRYSPELLGRPLTRREAQVCDRVAAGALNKEIAHELHLREGTVKVMISTVLAKTGLANRTCLAVWRVRTTG